MLIAQTAASSMWLQRLEAALDALDYSAKTYCENVCAMSDEALAEYSGSEDNSKKLKTLCDSLVAYAEAAQNVFSDYETTKVYCENDAVLEQIANAFITPNYVVDNSGMIKFSSVSFVCTKDARLRFYFLIVKSENGYVFVIIMD